MCKEQGYIKILIKFQRMNGTVQRIVTKLRSTHNYIRQWKDLSYMNLKFIQ